MQNEGSGVQFTDVTSDFRQLGKSFGQAFSKACGVKGAEPLSPSADGEIPYTAFLFDNFFCAHSSRKEKVAKKFIQFNNLNIFYSLKNPLPLCGTRGSGFFVTT